MNNDPKIICFQHCSPKTVFCKHIPDNCPICKKTIDEYQLDPFRMPYPFANARYRPTSIVLRPANGTFIDSYKLTDDLHIGLVDSEGSIVEYDKRGITSDDFQNWTDCLSFEVVPQSWETQWDKVLTTICKDQKWTSKNYGSNNNCFSFVIEFLKSLKYKDVVFASKEDMCNAMIMPRIKETMRYVGVCRSLNDRECFASD